MAKKRGIKAWVITWDVAGEHARDFLRRVTGSDQEVVAVLPPRLGPETVRRFVEQRYADMMFSASERLEYAKGSSNPYPAQFGEHTGQIHCGHNPMLYARKVANLRGVDDDHFTWDEPPPLPQSVRDAIARIRDENRRAGA
jgi:hypothetical protein